MASDSQAFDYIIVGGGTAGVVIASSLSTYFPLSKILLLEAGPDATNHPSVTNPLAATDFGANPWMFNYSTVPQEHCNNREIFNPGGRLLSGSSGINVGVWMRASSTDYEVIAETAGHERFRFESLLPVFKRLETHWDKNADPEYHGFEGRFHTVGGRKYPLHETIKETAKGLGHVYNPDAMKGDPTGLADVTQCFRATSESSAERQHSSNVCDLSKVTVMCEAPAARIIIESGKAVGVELIDGRKVFAKEEVVVSCGTQKTPQILMLSGIGPREELEKYKISVVVDSHGVGRNLFDHSAITLYFALKNPEKGYALPFNGTMQPEYGQGTPWEFNLFSNIPPEELLPVLESDTQLPSSTITKVDQHTHLHPKRCHYMSIPFYFPILATAAYNETISMLTGTHIALTSLHLLPLSRGTVVLASADPKDNPIIDPKFLSTATDRYILRTAVRKTLALTSTPPLSTLLAGETAPIGFSALSTSSTDEEIDARVRQFVGTIAHPMGTCALGTVLDSEFRVKGVKGLRVCDASVFPEPVGAMPSLTIYALAELCADLIAGGE